MHKAHFMSQTRITLPVTINNHYAYPTDFSPFRKRSYEENPDTAVFVSRRLADKWRETFDPWQLRDDFLTWPSEDWQVFCKRVGYFRRYGISKNLFVQWQQLLRKALILPPKEWKSLIGEFDESMVHDLLEPLKIRFEWEGEAPIARISERTALKAIIATIQVDALQGAQFRVCARHDCNSLPFKVEARHKIFCCSDCAHLVAVRNSRARAAEVKSKGAKKAPKRRQRVKETK